MNVIFPGFIHFARDPLRSYLNKLRKKKSFLNWTAWRLIKVESNSEDLGQNARRRRGSFTLHATHCGHTSINFEKKIKFIS